MINIFRTVEILKLTKVEEEISPTGELIDKCTFSDILGNKTIIHCARPQDKEHYVFDLVIGDKYLIKEDIKNKKVISKHYLYK